MKKKITGYVVLTSLALVLSGGYENASAENLNSESNPVFYVPHQDDETLSFGASIYNHVQAGHNVHVALLTDGSASIIRKRLNMTEQQFTAARNKEFYMALKNLGVKKENIHIYGLKDGQTTVSDIEEIMMDFENKYSNVKHKTFSWTDPHIDHSNAGKALKNLSSKNLVSDARYYIKQSDNPSGVKLIKESVKSYHKPFLVAASRSYGITNTRLGMYGIGHRSVPNSFDKFEDNPISRYHK